MRITVGGIIMVSAMGAGGFLLLSPAQGPAHNLGKTIQQVRERITSSLGLSAESTPTPAPFSNLDPLPPSPSSEPAPLSNAVPADPLPVPAQDVYVPASPPVHNLAEVSEPARVPVKKISRKARTKKTAVKKAVTPKATSKAVAKPTAKAVAKKPTPATGGDVSKLVGQYVVVKLVTGNEVKGVLEEKTASTYKINLPGLGPFTYPVQNVQSITAAQ